MRPRPLDPDPSQAPVIEHAGGPLLVSGGPGTGKSAVLVERFARLVESGVEPERIALFALDHRARREARDRLIRRLGRSVPDLPVFTAHGYAFRLVVGERFAELDYPDPPQLLSAPEQYAEVRAMLQVERKQDWPRFGDLLAVGSFARQVADFVLRCQERLLGPEDLAGIAARSGRPWAGEVAGFYRRYLDALIESNQIDFGGLLFQAATLLERELPEEDRFEHLLVDDYQDFTVAGEAIVRALGASASSVVVAADPDGHVFSYRGGSLEPLGRVREAFPGAGEAVLAESHRLGDRAAAVEALARPDGRAPDRPPAGMQATLFAHPGEEVEAVAHELLSARVRDDVPWSGMAVVVRRYGQYLTALRHALFRHGIPFVVVAEAAALATEPAVRPIVDLLRYVFRPERREDLLEPLLGSPVVGLDPAEVRRLRRAARTRRVTLLELVDGGEDLAGAGVPDELRTPVERFREMVRDVPELAARQSPDGLFFELWLRLPFVPGLVEDVGPRSARALDALSELAEALSRFAERRPGSTIQDYLEALEGAEFGSDPWTPPEDRHPDAVRVLSAHRAHGLEFDVVAVAGCLEGEFPSLGRPEPLVSLDRLVAPRPPSERMGERLAEERALFRLAVSRARRRTLLFASASTGSRTARTPSRFVDRLGLAWQPPGDRVPGGASLRSMESELRRVLADPESPAPERLAAGAALAHVGADPGGWWGRRAWTEGPVLYPPDEPIRTSYSRLSTMENCALQYLYSVELGLDPDETHQMWMGSLVHDIIDRVQRGDLPRTLEAMLEALEGSWRSEAFPNRAVEHRRFLDAREMLERWLEFERPDPVESEAWFEFELDGAVVRGRIDAVFRMENGHLRVVDYKTSRYPISGEEARENLQLAAYYLAVKRSPHLQHLGGEPGYLQLAFLGKGQEREGFARRAVSPGAFPDYEAWAEGRILELVDRIRKEDFPPSPEAECRWCRFKTICPRWPEGAEAAR
ncbi:MAG: ATP-dependent helicase [Actinobacteria bacterium]|nr:ATP-dependent helicase [Actinomycetota bacterium]